MRAVDISPATRKRKMFAGMFLAWALFAYAMAGWLLVPQWEPACPPHCLHIQGAFMMIGLASVSLAFGLLFVLRLNKAPTSLTVDDRGFTLVFRTKRTLQFLWDDPHVFIIIRHGYGRRPWYTASFRKEGVRVEFFFGQGYPIPQEAGDVLVNEANLHGCIVQTWDADGLRSSATGYVFIRGSTAPKSGEHRVSVDRAMGPGTSSSTPNEWVDGHVSETAAQPLLQLLNESDARLRRRGLGIFSPTFGIMGAVSAELFDMLLLGPVLLLHLVGGFAVGAVIGVLIALDMGRQEARGRRVFTTQVERVGFSPRGLAVTISSETLSFEWPRVYLDRRLPEKALLLRLSPSRAGGGWSFLTLSQEQVAALVRSPHRPNWALKKDFLELYPPRVEQRPLA